MQISLYYYIWQNREVRRVKNTDVRLIDFGSATFHNSDIHNYKKLFSYEKDTKI